MKKKDNIIIIAVFAAVIFTLAIGSLITKDRVFSPNENRNLSQPSQFTAERILDGEFEKDAENYVSDQIIWRDSWITIKSVVKRLMGNKDINGVYIADDDYYIERIRESDLDQDVYRNNIAAVKSFFNDISGEIPAERLGVILVPTSGNVLWDKLPQYAKTYDENGRIDEAALLFRDNVFLDIRDDLWQADSNGVQVYYRTDHHWTMEGAFSAYSNLHESRGTMPRSFKYAAASSKFLGTLYSKALLPDSRFDTVEIVGDWPNANAGQTDSTEPGANTKAGSQLSAEQIAKQMNDTYSVTADGKRLSGIYDMQKLSEKDKYAVFLGGNYGKVEITGGPKNGKNLLLIKDSFANSFVPYVCGEYESVTLIDLRYFSGNIREYMKERNINEVLVLYSMSNIITDKNLKKLNNKGTVLQ